MATVREIVQADLFAQVLQYRIEHPDSTIKEACDKVGLPERTFYRWVATENDAMDAVKNSLNDSQRAALFEFSQRIYTALTLLLDDAINPAIKTEVRLKILKFSIPLFDEFAKIHHATPGGEDRAPFLKNGPILEHAQSRLATLDLKIDENGVRIDVLQDNPIVEGTSREVQD